MIVLFNPTSTSPGKQPLPLFLFSEAFVSQGRHLNALERLIHFQCLETTGF